MGDDQQCHAVPGQALDHLQHFLDHLRVQRRGDLVEQHHLGVHAQRTDDGDALLLAAGQLPGKRLALVRQADPFQQCLGLGLGLAALALLHLERAEEDVVQHVHVGKQVIALEHHADLLAYLAPVGGRVQQLAAGKAQVTALGAFQAVEAAQQGALAAAAGAEDDDHLARRHAQVDVAQHLLRAEELVETLELDQCAHACVQRRSSTREAADSG